MLPKCVTALRIMSSPRKRGSILRRSTAEWIPACAGMTSLRIRAPRTFAKLDGCASRFLFSGRIETRDAAAFGARLFVDDRVDERRLARADRFFHRVAKLGR